MEKSESQKSTDALQKVSSNGDDELLAVTIDEDPVSSRTNDGLINEQPQQ